MFTGSRRLSLSSSSSPSSPSYSPPVVVGRVPVRQKTSSIRRPVPRALCFVVLSVTCIVAGLVIVLFVTVFYVSPASKVHVVQCNVDGFTVRLRRDDPPRSSPSTSLTSSSSLTPSLASPMMTSTIKPSPTTTTNSPHSSTSTVRSLSSESQLRWPSRSNSSNPSPKAVPKRQQQQQQQLWCAAAAAAGPSSNGSSYSCLEIRASYVLHSGTSRRGFLRRPKPDEEEDEEEDGETAAEFSETNACYCVNCCPVLPEYLRFDDDGDEAAIVSGAAVLPGNRSVVVGDAFDCSVRHRRGLTKSQAPLFYRTYGVNVQLLNAMFWPTLLFVVGVVGLFFAWIHLSRENSSNTRHQMAALRNEEPPPLAARKSTSTA